jgi:hypothetical protein
MQQGGAKEKHAIIFVVNEIATRIVYPFCHNAKAAAPERCPRCFGGAGE